MRGPTPLVHLQDRRLDKSYTGASLLAALVLILTCWRSAVVYARIRSTVSAIVDFAIVGRTSASFGIDSEEVALNEKLSSSIAHLCKRKKNDKHKVTF